MGRRARRRARGDGALAGCRSDPSRSDDGALRRPPAERPGDSRSRCPTTGPGWRWRCRRGGAWPSMCAAAPTASAWARSCAGSPFTPWDCTLARPGRRWSAHSSCGGGGSLGARCGCDRRAAGAPGHRRRDRRAGGGGGDSRAVVRPGLGRRGLVTFVVHAARKQDPAGAEAEAPELWREARRYNLPVKLALAAAREAAAEARGAAEALLVSLAPCRPGSRELWRAARAFETALSQTGRASEAGSIPRTRCTRSTTSPSPRWPSRSGTAPCLGLGGAAGQAWCALEAILERLEAGEAREALVLAGDQDGEGARAAGVSVLFSAEPRPFRGNGRTLRMLEIVREPGPERPHADAAGGLVRWLAALEECGPGRFTYQVPARDSDGIDWVSVVVEFCDVVVTGMGAISCFGDSADELWQAVLAGRPGIRRIPRLGQRPAGHHRRRGRGVAARAARPRRGDQPAPHRRGPGPGRAGRRRCRAGVGDRSGHLRPRPRGARAAIGRGLLRCGLGALHRAPPDDRHRLCLGDPGDWGGLSPGPPGAGVGLRGRRRHREATPFYLVGFSWLQALAVDRGDQEPENSCRPFDCARRGFALSEGGAALVLESLDGARARARPSWPRSGASAQPGRLRPQPPPRRGRGGRAVRPAGAGRCSPVPARARCHQRPRHRHPGGRSGGGGRPARGPGRALGDHPGVQHEGRPVTSWPPRGAWRIAALFTCRTGLVPPTRNLTDPDDDCRLDHVMGRARATDAATVLSSSSAWAGRTPPSSSRDSRSPRDRRFHLRGPGSPGARDPGPTRDRSDPARPAALPRPGLYLDGSPYLDLPPRGRLRRHHRRGDAVPAGAR